MVSENFLDTAILSCLNKDKISHFEKFIIPDFLLLTQVGGLRKLDWSSGVLREAIFWMYLYRKLLSNYSVRPEEKQNHY